MAGTAIPLTPESDSGALFELNPVSPLDLAGALEAARAAYQFYASAKNLDLARVYRTQHRTWVQNYIHLGKDLKLTKGRFGAVPQPPMAVEGFVADDLSRMELRPTTTLVMDLLPIPLPRPEPPEGNVVFGPEVGPWWPGAWWATAMTTVPAGYEADHPSGVHVILRVLRGGGEGMESKLWEAV